jgi:hypothetical protein
VVDLHAGIVPVELARHLPALRGEQVGERIAERGLPRVAQVQRAGRVGRDELDHPLLVRVLALRAEALPFAQDLAHHLLLGAGAMRRLMKPGPAISTSSISPCEAGLTRSASAISAASSRELRFRPLATCSATLQATSPWASAFVRSRTTALPGAARPASACSSNAITRCCVREASMQPRQRRDF